MPRLTLWLSAVALTGLALTACSQSSTPTTANAPAGTPMAQPVAGLASTVALGSYRLELAADFGAAAVAFEAPRSASANDDLYGLPIDNFLRSDSFKITEIRRNGTNLELGYVVTHPFPAPSDPLGTPNGSTNRSDLGIAGQVVLLADVPSASGNTYFTDVVANTALVTNAAGYYRPAGLLATSTIANTFPYQLLVDESGPDGSRLGISNAGDPTGNFGNDGWTRGEYGPTNDGWTGFGVLHQGQASTGMFALDLATLQTSGLNFDVAILAKYNDPRQGNNAAQKRANRLPPATPDASRFAYRMPHGALDVERVTFLGESGGFLASNISSSTLSAELIDWDARALGTIESDLALDADVTTVYPVELGAPTLEVSIPDVLGATVATLAITDGDPSGDPEPDSGRPDDPLYYESLVTATAPTSTAGTYTGLLCATDPEQGQVRDWQFYLDASLAPVAAQPEARTYQVVAVDVAPSNLPPTATVSITTSNVPDGGAVAVSISGINDPDDANVSISFDWDDDSVIDFTDPTIPVPAGPISYNSNTNGGITFTHTPPAPDYRTLAISISDGTTSVDITPALGTNGEHFTVLPPGACPNPAQAGTNITAPFIDNINLASGSFGHPYASTNGNHDTAAFHAAPYLGWFAYQVAGASTTRDIFRYPDTGAASAMVRVTNTNLGGALDNMLIHQIEVDSTNRIIFGRRSGAGTVSYPDNIYPIDGGTAQANIMWFDYTGTEVTALGGTINTGTELVIALTLDASDNIYMISQTHQLHRYDRALGYAEAAGYPINMVPILGDPTIITPTIDAYRVVDMVSNWHNDSLYVLGANNTASNNGRLHRILCDGTAAAGSPVSFTIVDLATGGHNRSSDIAIDQFNAAGGAIPEADVQIIIGGAVAAAGAPDLHIFNSALTETHSWDVGATIGVAYRICLAVSTNNVLVSRQSNSGFQWIFYTPPAGWL